MTIFSKKRASPLFLLAAVSLSVILTGCGGGGGGGIFKSITEEEKLNKSTVPLNVRGLTHCGGSLFVTNGSKIFRKGITQKAGSWSEVGGYGNNIATIASNGTDLYVMTWNTASETNGTTNPIHVHGGGDITGLGTIYNIFDNKVYGGTGQKCYAYTSTGTYQLTGTTATIVGAGIKSAYGDQLSAKDFCAGGRDANHDEPGAFNGIPANSEITGMAVYKGKLLVATNNVGYYKEVDGKWRPCPFDEEKNSGQFATQGTYPGGLWVVGNTIYLSLHSLSDSKRDGLWAYYGGDSAWNME